MEYLRRSESGGPTAWPIKRIYKLYVFPVLVR